MNHDLPELWLRDLAGEALSASERALLAEALRSDPELRRRLLADHWVDGTLRALGRSAGDAAEFVRSTTSRWRHEQDAATFVAGTVARARPDLQMPTRNRWRRWLAPLAAAAMLVLALGTWWFLRPAGLGLRLAESQGAVAVTRAGNAVPVSQGLALQVGDRVRLIPGHCDPTVNLYDELVCVRHGRVASIWPISARGALL